MPHNRDVALEFSAAVRRIPVYPVAAGYDLGREVALLASNESAFGPVPEVFDAVANALSHANRYPDPSYQTLRRALADRYGRRPVIVLSNLGLGLDFVLMALAQTIGWLFTGRIIAGITSASATSAGASATAARCRMCAYERSARGNALS